MDRSTFYCKSFYSSGIAQALRGTNKPVLVKNPVNPDLALWIGAMERLLGQDVKNLGVIHRGFSNYQKTKYVTFQTGQLHLILKSNSQIFQ
jgi:chorismate mutase